MMLCKQFNMETLPNVAGRLIYMDLSPRDIIIMAGACQQISTFAKQIIIRPTELTVTVFPTGSRGIDYVEIEAKFPDKEPLLWYLNQAIQKDGERLSLHFGGEREYLTTMGENDKGTPCLYTFAPNYFESVIAIIQFLTEFYRFPVTNFKFHGFAARDWPQIQEYPLVMTTENVFMGYGPGEKAEEEIIIRRAERGLTTSFTDCILLEAPNLLVSHLPFIKTQSLQIGCSQLSIEDIFQDLTNRKEQITKVKMVSFGLKHCDPEEIEALKKQLNLRQIPNPPRNHEMSARTWFTPSEHVTYWLQEADHPMPAPDRTFWVFYFVGTQQNPENPPTRVEMVRFVPGTPVLRDMGRQREPAVRMRIPFDDIDEIQEFQRERANQRARERAELVRRVRGRPRRFEGGNRQLRGEEERLDRRVRDLEDQLEQMEQAHN